MKEKKIAKGNVKKFNSTGLGDFLLYCKSHKQTCQRWLEFLEELKFCIGFCKNNNPKREDKREDLKQAIKIYEDAGI